MSPKARRTRKPFRLALLTGGGDCPGLNAVIRAAARSAFALGWEVYGIEDGFEGLLTRRAHQLHPRDVRGILHLGGTILGTSNRVNPFRVDRRARPGNKANDADRSAEVVRNFKAMGFGALIAIGGDGTLSIALRLAAKGIPVVGVPKTIDNDIEHTSVTFGFDTAVSTATDAIDKLHPTTEAHGRVMVVELMGRNAGFIALNSGVAGGADVILIPEIPFDLDLVCDKIREREKGHRGGYFSIVVVAEGARSKGGKIHLRATDQGGAPRLGGIGAWVAEEIGKRTGKETRSLVLGHLQRGGPPTTFDRLLGTRFGAAAVRAVKDGAFQTMVALKPPTIVRVPLKDAVGEGRTKKVPLDSDVVLSARGLGVSFGD
ncbi:MAG TPA: ATP-dependent 6-phosphofructokinase [Vicinamibacteria bacterium]|nr:ATP-dependent 6-phosphofructokinase [Vicinamibacteria bacterium]